MSPRPPNPIGPEPDAISLARENRIREALVSRWHEQLASQQIGNGEGGWRGVDPRWLAIGRAHLEQGFMALERAILEPWQFDLPEER
jgi:hypothetical protein